MKQRQLDASYRHVQTRSASFGAPVDDNTAEDCEIADLSVSWWTMVIIGLPDNHLPKCRDVTSRCSSTPRLSTSRKERKEEDRNGERNASLLPRRRIRHHRRPGGILRYRNVVSLLGLVCLHAGGPDIGDVRDGKTFHQDGPDCECSGFFVDYCSDPAEFFDG